MAFSLPRTYSHLASIAFGAYRCITARSSRRGNASQRKGVAPQVGQRGRRSARWCEPVLDQAGPSDGAGSVATSSQVVEPWQRRTSEAAAVPTIERGEGRAQRVSPVGARRLTPLRSVAVRALPVATCDGMSRRHVVPSTLPE